MNSKPSDYIVQTIKLAVPIMVLLFNTGFGTAASGQTGDSPPVRRTIQPGQPAPLGAPPPAGSGSSPSLLIRGDTTQPNPPASGMAQSPPVLGTDFPHQPAQQQAIIYQLRNDAQQRGWRMVDTRRAPGANSSKTVEVDDVDLEEQQNQDYPYPTASGKGPRIIHRYVLKDNSLLTEPVETKQHIPVIDEINITSIGKWQQQWNVGRRIHANTASWHNHELIEPCPTTLKFARWGVLLGLIFATVFMAFSAYSVVLGHKSGGQRVVGAAAGLMLLLMGYTIYKIVMINAFRYPYEADWDQTELQAANNVGGNNQVINNTPRPPLVPAGRVPRSPLPVVPLGASTNR